MLTLRKYSSLLILILLTALLYGQFLQNPLIFDDLRYFGLPSTNDREILRYSWSWLEIRSLPYASLAWVVERVDLDLTLLRGGNLALHILVVIALFIFLNKLFDHVIPDASHTRLAAFFAALLFAIHPVATYAVAYLIQRTILMATLFSLLAMWSYVYGSVHQNKYYLWATVPLYYFAVFSKEHVIMLPMCLLVLTVLLHQDWLTQLKQRWMIFLSLLLLMLTVVLIKKGWIASAYESTAMEMLDNMNAEKRPYPLSVLTQCWLFFKYQLLWLLPNPQWMSIDVRVPFAKAVFSPYLLAVFAFVTWGCVGLWLLLKRGLLGLVGFAMLFPWLMFMTELSTVRIQEPFVLYRSYFWAIGLFCLMPLLFIKIRQRMAIAISVVLVLGLLPISLERLATMSHGILVWDDAEKIVKEDTTLPGAYRIYHNRGGRYMWAGQYENAVKDLEKAVQLAPNSDMTHGSLALAYLNVDRPADALSELNIVLALLKKNKQVPNGRTHYNLAQAYEDLGQATLAAEHYQQACAFRIQKGCDKLKISELKR